MNVNDRLVLAIVATGALVTGVRLSVEVRDLRNRLRDTEQSMIGLRQHTHGQVHDPAIDSLRVDMIECQTRTNDLRAVLEVLIRTGRWPGRVELPKPVSTWGPWPTWGNNIGSITDPNPGWK